MIFLVVLVISTSIAAVVRRRERARVWARLGLGGALVVAGVAHLGSPEPFEQHLPGWVPAPTALVLASGVAEIVLGVALALARPHRRRAVGAIVAAFLIAVWPANIYVAVAGVDVDGQPGGVYPWVRVPLQVLFVAWALWSTHDDTRPLPPAMVLPWAAGPERGHDPRDIAVLMASRLELARWRDVPTFLVAALRLRRHFRSSPGGIGLALRAEPHRRRFWTFSVWTHAEAVDAFTVDPAHITIMRRFGPHMAGSAFVTWTASSPTSLGTRQIWPDAIDRLADTSDRARRAADGPAPADAA